MSTKRQRTKTRMAKARKGKHTKKIRHKAAGAKRTKVYKQLKKKGITSTIGTAGMTITKERIIPVNTQVTRNIGHPTKLGRRSKLGRFQKTHERIDLISRRYHYSGDNGIGTRLGSIPKKEWHIKATVAKLDRSVPSSGGVASSWISYLEWNPNNKTVTMGLLDGWNYVYKMTFKEYTGWYYASSKGTYWWVKLRSTYNNKYINKYKLL